MVLKVEDLCSGRQVRHVSFEVRKGEILGFAGLVGAGRTETMETIFGMRKRESGRIIKDGKELNIKSPQDAIENHISLLTEDRRGNGIIGLLSIRENMCVAKLNLGKYGMPLNQKQMRADTQEYIDKIRIKTPTMETPNHESVRRQSQQKVLVGRVAADRSGCADCGRAYPRHRRRRQGGDPLPAVRAGRPGKSHYHCILRDA